MSGQIPFKYSITANYSTQPRKTRKHYNNLSQAWAGIYSIFYNSYLHALAKEHKKHYHYLSYIWAETYAISC